MQTPKSKFFIVCRRFARVLNFTLFLVATCLSQSTTPDSDFQIWNETTLVFPIIKGSDREEKQIDKLSLLVFGVVRLGQNRLRSTDIRLGTGFDYRINRFLSFSPTYLYGRGEVDRRIRAYEHRIRFDLTVGNKWKRFSIKNRNRVEYRFRNSRSDSVRYRNRLTFTYPFKHKGIEVFSPYVHDEVYYDFTAKRFTTNEFAAGVSRKLTKDVTADLFYVRRDFRNLQVRYWNGIGVNLKVRID